MSKTVVVAEKPSVGRDIARMLGCNQQGEGFLSGDGFVVTWAIGHLVGLAQPHEINPDWRAWRMELLPMLPPAWGLSVLEASKEQFEIVRRLLNARDTARVVCATDAGREGELIFRNIYEASGCGKPVERLWISSLTPDAINAGFGELKPAAAYDALAEAAKGRARADWLVGMNLTRAYTLSLGAEVSVGRVQTPTLAMIVERDSAIEHFIPEGYCEIEAVFGTPQGGRYIGKLVRPEAAARVLKESECTGGDEEGGEDIHRLPADFVIDPAWCGSPGLIGRVDQRERKEAPPLLFDLTELQRVSNRLFGVSAKETLDAAQALYEKHKLLSYPRTDSRYLSESVASTLDTVVKAIAGRYTGLVASGSGVRPLGSRWVNDSKVSDHHAIIPTARRVGSGLSKVEEQIYDLVCRRLLQCWHSEHISAITTVITGTQTAAGRRDLWLSKGIAVLSVGWRRLEIRPGSRQKEAKEQEDTEQALPEGLTRGMRVRVEDVAKRKKKTRAPARFTDASLLTAMESSGRAIEEKELSEAMKDRGLGTPATRAAIIEVLIQREYVIRQGKTLVSTQKGRELIDRVDARVKSAALTGEWEAYLRRIERCEGSLDRFIGGIERFVAEIVGGVKNGNLRPIRVAEGPAPQRAPKTRKKTASALTSHGRKK